MNAASLPVRCHESVPVGAFMKHECDLSDHLQTAMHEQDVTRKDLAGWWACDRSLVDRVMENKHPLTDDKLGALPKTLQMATLRAWARFEGELVGQKAALADAIIGIARALDLNDLDRLAVRPAMLKADLETSKAKKETA